MARSTQGASASRWKYDVFFSFRGEDIREGIVSDLQKELQNREIKTTFMDVQGLERGMAISPSLLKAIEESRLAIVVFSPDYASSPECLEELTKICECMKDDDRILPVFYNVEPIDLRYPKRSFQEAFIEYENSGLHKSEKVQQWRDDLVKVANFSGWYLENYKSAKKLVPDIVKYVHYKVGHKEIDSIDQEEENKFESAISYEDFEATTQAVDQTQASRSQRPYAFLPAPRWNYDMFLSFWDEDTLKSIVSLLYHELENKRFKIFRDDMLLKVRTTISSNVQTAIEDSRFAIVVLSPNYASSTWCLDELTKCLEAKNTIVLPIFYNVGPFHVRLQKGSFGKAFTKLARRFRQDMEKVKQWKAALKRVANLSGWDSKKYKNESGLVKNIVNFLLRKVQPYEIDSWIKHVEATKQVKDTTSEPAPRWKHDVFLSFRGEDTRKNILSHLYHELEDTRGIKTFKDDQKLEKGTAISSNLLKAIEESRFAVVVLSENYAFSTWCLDELTHIFKCMGDKNTILPIFYNVDPSHVRKQEGTFAEAFTNHRNFGQDENKMHEWADALGKVASLSGWHSKNHKSERDFVEDIGKFVWSKVVKVQIDTESAMSTEDFEAFEATRKAMKEVEWALESDGVNIIGVYGTGGVGKTTMVKRVGEEAQKNELFDHVFMVFVSQSPDLRKIQSKLAEKLGLKFQEEIESERARRLKKRIMGAHKILIILDNIWKSIDLSRIGIPSSNELRRCQSKVLLTTRKRDICQALGSQEVINLTRLSEEDSFSLFRKQSGKAFESTDFYNAAMKVAKQCAGLPMALLTVAKALRDKVDLDEWQKAAQQLEKTSQTPKLLNCIKLSYDYLKGEYVKSCFLLCCLFPDDDDIRIADLMEYGYGIGLFHNSNTMQEARATTHLAVIYLKACNLLMDGAEDGCIRMHDVIRNMAMSILHTNGHHFFPPGKKEDGHRLLVKAGCQLKDWPMDADGSYSAISVMRNEIRKLPEELVCSKLQILLLQGNAYINDIPNTFFPSANTMRVLDLSDTRISSLPQSFRFLTNLQALYLDGCLSLIEVSILKEVKKLQILSMREFPLKELPKEIGDLSNLRILDFTSECVDTVPSKVMSRLHKLEELYMQCNFTDWESKVKEAEEETNARFDELTSLSQLYILKVNISDAECLPENIESFSQSWVIFDIRISREPLPRDYHSKPCFSHDHSRTLTLSSTINTLPDWFIMSVTKQAESLQYIECSGLKNMLVEYERGILHGLKYLAVIGCHENLEELMNTITCVPVPNEPVFESLEELHLVDLYCLKELCVGELPPRSLCNLKLLKVEACPNLMNALLPSIFPNLTILVVTCCIKLKSLFASDVAQCLLQLEDLSVAQCPSLDRVIEASEETVNKRKIAFPKLKSLVLCNLPQLTWFYCTGSATIDCPLLEQLYVQDCPNFSTSTSDFHTWKQVEVNDLRHLRTNNEMSAGPTLVQVNVRPRAQGSWRHQFIFLLFLFVIVIIYTSC